MTWHRKSWLFNLFIIEAYYSHMGILAQDPIWQFSKILKLSFLSGVLWKGGGVFIKMIINQEPLPFPWIAQCHMPERSLLSLNCIFPSLSWRKKDCSQKWYFWKCISSAAASLPLDFISRAEDAFRTGAKTVALEWWFKWICCKLV